MKPLKFDKSLIEDLTKMIDDNNVLAKSFRRVRDFVHNDVNSDFSFRLFRHRCKDPTVYNTPTTDKIATLIMGDMSNMDVGRNITVKKSSGQLFRLHETHTTFIPLQYPLTFPFGEDGYQEHIPIKNSIKRAENVKEVVFH